MGIVYLVGAGPGDPKLITIKGMELLKTCDAVIYDRLASFQLLDYLRKDCVKIYVGKESGHHSKTQEEINKIIVDCTFSHEKVVRLKGGDPFVFGRGGEEIEVLKANNIPFQVIPGITSAISVLESVGIPVTHRGISQSFHVITGHTKESDTTLTDNYDVLAKLDGTLIFLMGLSNIREITKKLIENGKDQRTPVAVISSGTMNHEKTVRGTLSTIVSKVEEEQIVSPAIIVVGNAAALHFVSEHSANVLSGVKIGITGTRKICEKLESGLVNLGAKVYMLCDMNIEETPKLNQLDEELQYLDKYQWIVFTSQNAIDIFFERLEKCQIDRRNLNQIKFAVIGSGTKQALKEYGYYADFMPTSYTTKDLANEFSTIVNENDRLLIPRALQGSKELNEIFDKNNIKYKDIPIYDVRGKLLEDTKRISKMNCLIFVSASGASAFFKEIHTKLIELPTDIKIACIGEITAREVEKYKMDADIIAKVNNIDGLICSVGKYKW